MDRATVSEQQLEISASGRSVQSMAVGTAPVNWNNDDLPNWRPPVAFSEMLDAMAAAGYSGTEYGAGFPRDPVELQAEFNARDLELCGSYHWFHFQDAKKFSNELDALDPIFRALSSVGCTNLIVASAMIPERIGVAGRVPTDESMGWSRFEWEALQLGLARIRDRAAGWRITPHFHNHVGSHVESPSEVERLVTLLPEGVDLCFDTGHYAFGGGDPVAFVQRHAGRIGYLHLKDVDENILALAKRSGRGFLDALRQYIFCELGQGAVDIPQIVATLKNTGYSGWVIVEQDTCPGDPTATARRNREFLRSVCEI
jgi:inosose dehydratase